jgi:hypothetical protein
MAARFKYHMGSRSSKCPTVAHFGVWALDDDDKRGTHTHPTQARNRYAAAAKRTTRCGQAMLGDYGSVMRSVQSAGMLPKRPLLSSHFRLNKRDMYLRRGAGAGAACERVRVGERGTASDRAVVGPCTRRRVGALPAACNARHPTLGGGARRQQPAKAHTRTGTRRRT